jgi:TatD DNase family protein
MFIDIHTHHYTPKSFIAVCNPAFEQAEKIFSSQEKGFFSVGIHPWDVHCSITSQLDKLDEMLADKRVVAVGECGLDRNSKATIKEQNYFFERQIQISEAHKKPMILHCVACFNEIMTFRKNCKPVQDWIIHGFRGKPELAKQLLRAGFSLSFSEKFNPLSVDVTPLDKLCVETDESLLPIEEIYRNIAHIKRCLPQDLNAGSRILRIFTY